jgi:uncharacterized protein YacL (UPF0231 family)
MEIFELFDDLEELISGGSRIPLTGKVVVNEDEVIEVIEQIRNALPEELRQARWVMKERQRIIADAEQEAREIVEQGKEYTNRLIDENEVTKKAEQKAQEIIQRSQEVSQEIKIGAYEYAEKCLARLEQTLGELLRATQRGREELKKERQ